GGAGAAATVVAGTAAFETSACTGNTGAEAAVFVAFEAASLGIGTVDAGEASAALEVSRPVSRRRKSRIPATSMIAMHAQRTTPTINFIVLARAGETKRSSEESSRSGSAGAAGTGALERETVGLGGTGVGGRLAGSR